MIFENLKQIVNNFLGSNDKDAVIAVPTYFNYFQRETIKCSMTISGFNCLRIIDECSAVALFYSFRKKNKYEKNILIFDLGAGSLSVAIANINKEDETITIEMKSLNGNLHLGGEDFDNRLLDYCCNEFRKKNNIDISHNQKAISRLRKYCEKAKIDLSEVTIDIESLIDDLNFNLIITRDKFQDLCSDLFKKCLPPLENAIKDAKLSESQINEIILVGGSS